MLYAISDIHGRANKFFKMLKLIEFNDNDTLYILGDIPDRGNQAFEIFDYIMGKKNIKCLMGNHEEMMIKGLEGDGGYFQCWLQNGGNITYKQFIHLGATKQKEICDFIESFKFYEELEVGGKSFILTHAGISMPIGETDKDTIISMQSNSDFLWSREDFYYHKAIEGYTIIFGHTPVVNITGKKGFKIWHDDKYNDKIGIDCGAGYEAYGGRLACLRLDDMKEFYI